jgi:hypothetical protein
MKGFGPGLIERMLRSDFQAEQSAQYTPNGLQFTFAAPFDRVRALIVGSSRLVLDVSLVPGLS